MTTNTVNPYRDGSNYHLIFECLYKMTKEKPASKKELLKEIGKRNNKPDKLNAYSLAVVISPSKDGLKSHKSAKQASLVYWVEKLNDGMIQLHIR